jgi:dimethylglycine dehydrogenase
MRTVLAPLLTRQGRIRGDLTVTRLDEDRYLLIGSPAAEFHYLGLLAATAPRTVTVRNLTEMWGGLSLSGPEARSILDSICPVAEVPLFGSKWVDIGAACALAIRISFTGEHGYEIYAPATRLRLIHGALLEAGRNLGLRHIGVNALNALRLEKLYPSFGSELTQDFNPFEAGLERYVRVDKPGFIGRSAVLEQVGRAPAKQLCGLVLDPGDLDPVGAEPVFRGGAFVGSLTSAAYGHRIGRAVALAYLPAALSHSGADMDVQVLGRRLGASVCLFPPYDPHGARLRCR